MSQGEDAAGAPGMAGAQASPPSGAEVVLKSLGKEYPAPLSLRGLLGLAKGRPRRALGEVSFEVGAGEVVAIIGPNGAGKTTLLRILSGLLLPSEGSATVAGLDVVRDRPRSRALVGAALGEDRGLSPRITVRQNLTFYAALFGVPAAQVTGRIAELADHLEATRLLDRPVRTLSTGEKARAVLVRALLHRPRLVLIDELTRSLDPGAARRLRGKIVERVATRGASVLFASHDLLEVEAISSRVVLLDRGRVAALGSFASVQHHAEEVFSRVAEREEV